MGMMRNAGAGKLRGLDFTVGLRGVNRRQAQDAMDRQRSGRCPFPGGQGFRGYGLELQLIEGSVETAIKFQVHRVSN